MEYLKGQESPDFDTEKVNIYLDKMTKWYVITFDSIKDKKYWEEIWNDSTVIVSQDDFEAVSRAFYHTHRHCHYVELHDGNIHAYPKYIQNAYKNRENYVSPK